MKNKAITMIALLALVAQSALVEVAAANPAPEYAVESVASIMRELGQKKYENTVKEWLKMNRPAQYKKLFEPEKVDKEAAPQKEGKGDDLISALVELNAAIADPQIAILDFYINSKAQDGWLVVSLTDKVVVFRRAPNASGKPGAGAADQPAAIPDLKSDSKKNPEPESEARRQ